MALESAVATLASWRDNDDRFAAVAKGNSQIEAALPISGDIAALAAIGLDAMAAIESSHAPSTDWHTQAKDLRSAGSALRQASASLLSCGESWPLTERRVARQLCDLTNGRTSHPNAIGILTVQPAHTRRIEPRWPVALVVVAGCVLLALLPGRLTVFPSWVPYAVTVVFLVPMAALTITTAKGPWLRIEAAVTVVIVPLAAFGIIDQLMHLLSEMVRRPASVSGSQLLSSSISVWVMNVLIFSLAYWRIDRGGPEARANGINLKSDWFFPEEDRPEIAHSWKPTFVDYLFLAFCTATTFSPAEAQPISSRAKLLMIFESAVSLVTIVAVAARAINILDT